MEGQWRSEIPEDMRKTMITEMYHELARISGEVDKQKVWGSAAKFELMLWSSSPDRNSYLMKMQRKIVSLKKKQGANLMANANNVVTSNAMNPPVNGMTGLNMNMNAAMNAQFQQNNVAASQAMNSFQQQAQAQAQAQVQAQVQAQAQAQQQNAAALAASNGASLGASTGFSPAVTAGLNSTSASPTVAGTTPAANIPTPPQQQAQQWLQRIQVQFQAQQRQLMHTQNQETQQLRQQHMNQQQQLSQQQQQQGVAPDMRRQQLQTLQQQHQLARTRLQHLHKSKQQQLQRKQQQYLMQKQHQLQLQQHQQQQQQDSVAATIATASTNGVSSTAMMAGTHAGVTPSSLSLPNATMVQTTAPTVSTTQAAATPSAAQCGVKPEQLAASHMQQAAMREMQRAQNTAQIHADNALAHQLPNGTAATTTSSTPTAAAAATTATATTSGGSDQTYVERLKETKQKYWDDLVIVYREFERMVKQKPANQQQERINTFLVNLKRIIALLQQDPSKVTSNNKSDLDRVEAHIQKQVLPILERLKNKTRAAAATTGSNGSAAAAQQEQLKKNQETQRLAQLQEQQKKLQEQQNAEAERKLLEEQKKKLQFEVAAAAAKKQEMLEQQRKQKQKQLQAQHAQQQAILQQQQRQRLLAQQAQLKAQDQLRMNATAPQQASTVSGAIGVTPAPILTAGDDLATTSATNGTGVSPTSASRPTPIDVSVSLSPGETNTSNGMASLTPAQYRTFKLPEARKQQLTAQHAKLREQQQELIMQQSRAKTPSHQAKLAHQAQRLAQMTNKISQQLVQCKLAEEYEQSNSMGMVTAVSQPALSQSTATPSALDKATTTKPEVAACTIAKPAGDDLGVTSLATTLTAIEDETVAAAKKNDSFKSVLPDMTGLSASEKLLTAVAAYEKHKPDVLKRGASRFSRIALTIGAKLNTSYVT